MNTIDIIITVQGASQSGKGTCIAAITHALQNMGATVFVQSAETHNKEKLEKTDAQLKERLSTCSVLIMEQRTI